MSTDAIEQEQATGPDDGYEPALRPPVGDMGEEGEKETVAQPSWLEGADEEIVKYAESKGFADDPMKALKGQREAEVALRKEQSARADMERELAEMREAGGAQSQQQHQGDDPFQLVAAATAYENGEITMAQLVQHQQWATLTAAEQMAQAMIGQEVTPLRTESTTRSMNETAAQLAQTYPDFADLSDEVMAMIDADPKQFGTATGMKAAFGLVRAGRDAKAAQETRRASRVETLDQGSRGNGGQDAAEAIKKQLREIGGRRDGL